MPYVSRDESSRIVGVFANPQFEGQELQESAEVWKNPADALRVQIEAIEYKKKTSRNTREALIYLAEKEAQAVAASYGVTPEQVLAANVGYQNEKAIDLQIAALRAQIQALE